MCPINEIIHAKIQKRRRHMAKEKSTRRRLDEWEGFSHLQWGFDTTPPILCWIRLLI